MRLLFIILASKPLRRGFPRPEPDKFVNSQKIHATNANAGAGAGAGAGAAALPPGNCIL